VTNIKDAVARTGSFDLSEGVKIAMRHMEELRMAEAMIREDPGILVLLSTSLV
jgi:hypothetical protein